MIENAYANLGLMKMDINKKNLQKSRDVTPTKNLQELD